MIEIINDEAVETTEIEGEYLNGDSVQSSIKKNLGLVVEKRKISSAEYDISPMMVDLFPNYKNNLSRDQLFEWHK